MAPISIEKDGIQIKIQSVKKNKVFSCENCMLYDAERCSIKKRLSLTPNTKKLVATEIIVIVANVSDKTFSINSKNWETVDTEGFSYGCFAPCDSHIEARMVNPDSWEVTPGTQVKFALLFPELEEKINIVSLLYSGRLVNMRLDVRKPTKKVEALLLAKENYEKSHHRIQLNNK